MDSRVFLDVVKSIITEYWNKSLADGQSSLTADDIFITWLSKTLQNAKAMASTTLDDRYFEVTYNGDKDEIYLDVYKKKENILFNIKYDDEPVEEAPDEIPNRVIEG